MVLVYRGFLSRTEWEIRVTPFGLGRTYSPLCRLWHEQIWSQSYTCSDQMKLTLQFQKISHHNEQMMCAQNFHTRSFPPPHCIRITTIQYHCSRPWSCTMKMVVSRKVTHKKKRQRSYKRHSGARVSRRFKMLQQPKSTVTGLSKAFCFLNPTRFLPLNESITWEKPQSPWSLPLV